MKKLKIVSAALMLGLGLLSGAAQAADASCDRACLKAWRTSSSTPWSRTVRRLRP